MENWSEHEGVKLPEAFLAEMERLLGAKEYGQYLASFGKKWNRGLRVNVRKISGEEFCRRCPQTLNKVPWISHGYIYDPSWTASKDVDYYAGLYYLQEPSAMTPASLLPVEPGDRVLDLCAAPGGKATELGVKLKGEGLLFANDISNSRAMALLKNLELFGIPNSCVTCETPERLADALPGFFDKVLVDAPCSGEGMFRREPGMIKDWLEKGPGYYQPLQREILQEAVKLLKPGGYLLYSTCTFSVRENEENVEFLLKANRDMELVPLPGFSGAADGIGLSGVIRLFPHRIDGEGHFAALLRKKGREEREDRGKLTKKRGKGAPQNSEAWEAFRKDLRLDLDDSRIRGIQDKLYYLPEGFPEQKRLRYLRTGLLLGTLNHGRFEPSQALAMCLRAEEFCRSVSFSREDERVMRYLKGETVILPGEGEMKGWCLVCLEGGFPLGWAKGMGKVLKNKYYPGWRYQG